MINHSSTGAGPVQLDRWLTSSEHKAWLFSHDPYFRDGWRDVRRPDALMSPESLKRLSFVLVKPDGIVARSVGRIFDSLAADGFVPVSHSILRFDRLMIRELWRYELSRATDQRFDAIDVLLTATNSLLVVVEDRTESDLPAATRLSKLKGPSRRAERQPWQLRSRIDAGDGLLNFIHTPDEPADVVRELGVLLDSQARRAVLACAGFDLTQAQASVYEGTPAYDFDAAACAQRLEALKSLTHGRSLRTVLENAAQSLRAGRACDWQGALEGIQREQLTFDRWDGIAFAAMCTTLNLVGVAPLIDK